jgi:hypothetical protein
MDLRKDIYFFADFASFPANGSTGVLYVDKDTGFIYSWNGVTFLASGTGGLNYLGTWNANTNSPSIASGVGSNGDYYIVGTPGTTNIDGISSWDIGDWIIFGGSAWQKIDNSETTGYVTSVSGTAPIASSGGTTPAISIADAVADGSTKGAASFTASDFNSSSGNISIDYTNGQAASASNKGFLTSTDWTTFNSKGNGTVTSVGLSTGTTGTDVNVSGSPVTGSSSITLNIPNSSATSRGALRSADWTTFNGKQDAITLTTTGTSGAATLVGSTLNIPQYAGGLTYFTEAQNTTAPNATIPVDSLTAVSAATDADFSLRPKGTGAIIASIPDNTTTGGNKRGQYAVDLARTRSNAANVASGNYSFNGGQDSTASGANSFSFGQSLSSGSNSTAIGNAQASANYSAAFGQATASALYSFAGGASTASGQRSTAFGQSNIASGIGSFTGGQSNTSSGDQSSCFGESNTASGHSSSCIGNTSTANADYSAALGLNAHVFGIYGRRAHANGREATNGDAQRSNFILRERTTDASATALTTNSSSASTTNQVILSNQSAYRFKGTIIGKQSGSTNVAAWDIDGLIVRGANAASTTLVVSNVNLVSNASSWGTPTLSADPFNGGLQVQVTGAATTNIQWVAIIETTEVIYA